VTSSYNVRIWSIRSYRGRQKTTYTVRWTVAGKSFPATFGTRKLAEGWRAKLVTAAREGVPFDDATGLPEPMSRKRSSSSWYEHACAFVDMKWPRASAKHRKSIADALATVTPALLASTRGAPSADELRHALYTWSFNAAARSRLPEPRVRDASRWIAGNTVPVSDLADSVLMRRALDTLALTLSGTAAAPTTVARKRAVFSGALRYAVELGLLESHPFTRVQWSAPKSIETVDRRVVVNPNQARALLAAVDEIHAPLTAFFGCMYYAALRPAEALHLRDADCTLPREGWGELLLVGSTQQSGRAWSDSGHAKEDRGLKHRARRDTRAVPACPDLVGLLRRHIDEFGTGSDGRLFVTRTGRFGRPVAGPYGSPVSTNSYGRVWRKAREKALSKPHVETPLAGRPYDLRHACLSTWLNAGVEATQVAEWAGHSVHVLMRVYAKCIYGQKVAAQERIEAELSFHEPE
jgi:integrase